MSMIRTLVPEKYHTYLGIPYDEEIVPFPNFGTVLIQHRRYLPDKPAFIWKDVPPFTFKEWGSGIRLLSDALKKEGLNVSSKVCLKPDLSPETIFLFHALLDGGIPAFFAANSDSASTFPLPGDVILPEEYILKGPTGTYESIHSVVHFLLHTRPEAENPFDIPYVSLDHPALFFSKEEIWYEFSQYNLLSAAQSVGKELSLFREGETLFAKQMTDPADWLFAALTTFYYGSTTRFDTDVDAQKAESILKEKKTQVLIPDISNTGVFSLDLTIGDVLRDTAVLYRDSRTGKIPETLSYPWRYFWTAPIFAGNGIFINGRTGSCCKGLDFKVSDSPEGGRLLLLGHSIPHAIWMEKVENLEDILKNDLLTPFHVHCKDPQRRSFIVLDD
ncbi:MAG: hypothetical protein PWP06_194 [Candidatus Marinimicrobia bacterium]|jgi:hypothetical protein|nr:hypothetical protein [Candidatus Neomarinimicrobiota bacterium]